MNPGKSRSIAFVCRWGAVSMAQGCDLETRLRTLLLRDKKRGAPKRFAAALTLAAAITATLAVNVFHLQSASATGQEASITAAVPSHVLPPYAVALPGGVVARVIAVSRRPAAHNTGSLKEKRVWWTPNGTRYSFPPGQEPAAESEDAPLRQLPGDRRYQFVMQVEGQSPGDYSGFSRPNFRAPRSDSLAMTSDPGNPVARRNYAKVSPELAIYHGLFNANTTWDYYCSEPASRKQEQFDVALWRGPWKHYFRRPIVKEIENPARIDEAAIEDLKRTALPLACKIFRTGPSNSGTPYTAVIISKAEMYYPDRMIHHIRLFDSTGRRLNLREIDSADRPDYQMTKFIFDKATADRAYYVAFETGWIDLATINHIALELTKPARP